MEEVKSAASPAGKFGDQYGINFAPLSERHHLLSLSPIEFGARPDFLKDADDLIAGALRESGQIALLPSARLIGGRDTAIESGTLSQLNSPRLTGRNPLSLLGPAPYRTA